VNPAAPGDAPASAPGEPSAPDDAPAPDIKPVAVPIPPDRPTLSTDEFLKLLAAQGVEVSKRTLQRHASAGDFSDRYPGWKAERPGKSWLISPIDQ